MPLYRHNGRIVFFIHIPKTGGTSIERTFRDAGCAEALRSGQKFARSKIAPQHMHRELYELAIAKGFYDYQFAVVRNPFDRIASHYGHKVTNKNRTGTPDAWINAALNRLSDDPFTNDNHLRPQVEFIGPDTDVFKFEVGLDVPVAVAFSHLGLTPPDELPHVKKGSDQKLSVSARTLDRIAGTYADDFEKFGYSASNPGERFTVKRRFFSFIRTNWLNLE
jgi:hypothetical protein